MLFRIAFTILAQSLSVVAQNAVPTNTSFPAGLGNSSELGLTYSSNNQNTNDPITFNVDFAIDASSGQRTALNTNPRFFVNGTVFIVNPSNINSLGNGSIAYINCDPDVYSNGNLNLSATIQAATQRITMANPSQGSPQQGAIVLYSQESFWCNYTVTGSYNYPNVFVLPGGASNSIKLALQSVGTFPIAQITFQNNTYQSNDNQNNDNSSITTPSTTVAMIILYSVTGIITLCFVVVIVSGAMRARRHPERYGLLNLPGNAHQRRARGIARAMLETIPIVKFGEKEPMKMATDVEQGTEMHPVARVDSMVDNAKEKEPDSTDQSITERAGSSAAHSHDAETPTEDDTNGADPEDGLVCSVCTEDFVKGENLRVLPCNHKFHPDCIDPWLLNVSGTCPLCRVDLRPPGEREESANNQAPIEGTSQPSDMNHQPGFVPHQGPRFSTFLNRHRMRESTPAQRLRALRALRNYQRTTGAVSNTADESATPVSVSTPVEEAPTRSNRVSRFFGRGEANTTSTPAVSSVAPPETVSATPADIQQSQQGQRAE